MQKPDLRCSALRITLFVLVGMLTLLTTTSSAVQDLDGRRLGGYRFIPSNSVDGPFITTHFGSATGFGVALNVKLPVLVVDQDTLLALDGNVVFVQLGFDYQYAANDRVAFHFAGHGASRLGTNAQSMLSQGVAVVAGFDAGSIVRIWNNDDMLLSGVGMIGFGNTFAVDLKRFAEDVIDGQIENAAIVFKDDGALLGFGCRGAWAIRSWAGLIAQSEVIYRNTVFYDSWAGRVGMAGSVDLGQRGWSPVGLVGSVTYDNTALVGDQVGGTFSTGLEVFYTGRDDFVVGLQISFNRTPLKNPDITLYGSQFNLTTRYYF